MIRRRKTMSDTNKKCTLYGTLQVRAMQEGETEDKGYVVVEGKATPFNDETLLFKDEDFGNVYEAIDPHAFDRADRTDVVFDKNHDFQGSGALARTRNKTLELEVREDGLYYKAKLNRNNPQAMQLYEEIKEGLMDRCSFAFYIDDWENGYTREKKEDGIHCRVKAISKVRDVSAVTFPAYSNTNVGARFAEDLEKFKAKLESDKTEELRQQIISRSF